MKDFSPRERQAIEAMWLIHASHEGAACKPVGDWLVKQAKRTWPRFAGWRGPQKTNVKRSWTIVSYHHPAQLCWLWAVWLTLAPSDGHWWKLFGGDRWQVWFGIKHLFRVRLHRQPNYSWMLSGIAKQRLQAIAGIVDNPFVERKVQ